MPNICRLCLQSDSEKYYRMDTDSYCHKMQLVCPEINIEMVEDPFICGKCSELLLSAYSFKSNCLQTDEELKTYTNHGGKQINIEEFLRQKNLDVLTNIKLETIEYVDVSELNEEDSYNADTLGEFISVDPAQKPENCTQEVNFKKDLSEIKVSKTNKKITENNTIKKQKNVANKCPICNKVFLNKMRLDRHLKANTHYKCTVCNLNVAWKSLLEEHMRSHTGERPFQCTYCGKAFAQSGTLGTHVRSLHLSERPHVCELCGMSFPVRGAYTSHKKKRHNTEEKKFICSFCGKGFVYKNYLDEHMKWHTGERNFLCQVCSKRFVNNASLKKHMRMHNGEKPYECPICQKTFSMCHNMKIHLKSCARRNARTADATND